MQFSLTNNNIDYLVEPIVSYVHSGLTGENKPALRIGDNYHVLEVFPRSQSIYFMETSGRAELDIKGTLLS